MSPHYRLALLCLLAATFFTSTAGVLLRWIESADGWTVNFYRAAFFVLTLSIWLLGRYRWRLPQAFGAVGLPGLVIALCFAGATIAFVFALLATTVAKVVLINGMIPFVTALLAWWLLRERVAQATLLAMVVAFAGIAIMVTEELAGGSLRGDLLSLCSCFTTAVMYVAMRRRKGADMVPAIFLGGLLVAIVAAIFAPSLSISPHDLAVCAALGVLQLGVQYVLVAFGTQHVPAAEAALSARLTIVLGPFWAWLGAGELPSDLTLLGGGFVVAAIFGNGLWSLRRDRVTLPNDI